MEEPRRKRIKLSYCIICNSSPHATIPNKGKFKNLVINHLLPFPEKLKFSKSNIFDFCPICLDILEELVQLQYSLDFITKTIRKKENEIKCKILLNRKRHEQIVIKTFRDGATKSLLPRILMCKKNSLFPQGRSRRRSGRLSSLSSSPGTSAGSQQSSISNVVNCTQRVPDLRKTIKQPDLTETPKRALSPRKDSGQFEHQRKLINCNVESRVEKAQHTKFHQPPTQKKEKVKEIDPLSSPKRVGPLNPIKKMDSASPAKRGRPPNSAKKVVPVSSVKQLEPLSPFKRSDYKTLPPSSSNVPPQAMVTTASNAPQSSLSATPNASTQPGAEPASDGTSWPKPPLTYVQLCVLAIMSQENMCVIGREIYAFFRENFPYFREIDSKVWVSQVRNALRTPFFCECPERRFEEPFLKSGLKVFSVVESEVVRIKPRIDKFLDSQIMVSSMSFPERVATFKKDIQKEFPSDISKYIPRKTATPKLEKEKKTPGRKRKIKEPPAGELLPQEEKGSPNSVLQVKQEEPPPVVPINEQTHQSHETQYNEQKEPPSAPVYNRYKDLGNRVSIDEQQYTPNGFVYQNLEAPSNSNSFNQTSQPSNGTAYNEPPNGGAYVELNQPPYDNDTKNMSNGYIINELKQLASGGTENAYGQNSSTAAENNAQIINCLPINTYVKPTLTGEELCVVAIMNMDSMLVSASDVYDFITENFPSFYGTDIYAQLPTKNYIKSVLSQAPFYFFAKWDDANFAASHSPEIAQWGYADVYQLLYTVMYNYAPHFRKIIASKLSSKENMALMAFNDRVYAFIQNVLEKPIVPDYHRYVHLKMQSKMIPMEYPPRVEGQMVETNQWVQPAAYTNTNYYSPYPVHNNTYPSTSTNLQ